MTLRLLSSLTLQLSHQLLSCVRPKITLALLLLPAHQHFSLCEWHCKCFQCWHVTWQLIKPYYLTLHLLSLLTFHTSAFINRLCFSSTCILRLISLMSHFNFFHLLLINWHFHWPESLYVELMQIINLGNWVLNVTWNVWKLMAVPYRQYMTKCSQLYHSRL